jgi:hypothetical protein
MACPACDGELDEGEVCPAGVDAEPSNLPVVISSPAPPTRAGRAPLARVLRPALPVAGGIAAVAVTASLALAGLRLRPAGFRLPWQREPAHSAPLIEIEESIVVRAYASHLRVR